MERLFVLSLNDFKLIFRDKSLRIFLIMPMLILALVLLFLPFLFRRYEAMETFVAYLLMAATVQTSVMFGFIYAIVLIHEKDMQVAKVYGVMPVSKTGFLSARMAVPFLISSALTFLLLLLQPFYSLSPILTVLASILCGLLAPLLATLVSILSKNKMEGLTWFKIINLFVTLPLGAFFIPRYAVFFGLLPTHWLFQALDHMIKGRNASVLLSVGFIYITITLVYCLRQFARKHFQ